MATKMPLGAETTTEEILKGVRLDGKLALVTGASSGIGEETARALAGHGAKVVLAVRDLAKGEEAAARIRESVPDAALEVVQVDLGSLASIRRFGQQFLASHSTLDLLIANAGVMACPFSRTSDGFEMQFGTNHVGHFLLVNLLVPAVLAATPSRIVVVSSAGHRRSDVDLINPNYEGTEAQYDKFAAYGRSKTANILFAVALDDRLKDKGVRSFALHPGAISTNLGRHLSQDDIQQMMRDRPGGPRAITRKSIPAGAATTIYAAVSPDLDGKGGLYLEDCHIAEITGPNAPAGVRSYAYDRATADALWTLSEKLVDQRFDLS